MPITDNPYRGGAELVVDGIHAWVCESCLRGDHQSFGQDHREGEPERCGCKNVTMRQDAQCACTPDWPQVETALVEWRKANGVRGFEPGDDVTFTSVKSTGGSFTFSTREGKLVEELGGGGWLVKGHGGHKYWVAARDLRHAGERTALTETMDNMAELIKAKEKS